MLKATAPSQASCAVQASTWWTLFSMSAPVRKPCLWGCAGASALLSQRALLPCRQPLHWVPDVCLVGHALHQLLNLLFPVCVCHLHGNNRVGSCGRASQVHGVRGELCCSLLASVWGWQLSSKVWRPSCGWKCRCFAGRQRNCGGLTSVDRTSLKMFVLGTDTVRGSPAVARTFLEDWPTMDNSRLQMYVACLQPAGSTQCPATGCQTAYRCRRCP